MLVKTTNIVSGKARILTQVCLILKHKALWQQASCPKYPSGSTNECNTLKSNSLSLLSCNSSNNKKFPITFSSLEFGLNDCPLPLVGKNTATNASSHCLSFGLGTWLLDLEQGPNWSFHFYSWSSKRPPV